MEEIFDPMHQFEIHKYFDFHLFGVDISFTNSSLMMVLVAVFISIFSIFATRKTTKKTPHLSRMAIEFVYEMSCGILQSASGNKSTRKFASLIMTIMLYVAMLDLVGMFLFSPTSHISVTIPLGIVVFCVCVIASLIVHRHHFFSMFIPSGIPFAMKPLMLCIELFSYLTRPFSLGLRLTANILAGHVMLAVISSFSSMIGIFGFLPLVAVALISIFECAVGVFQAYIFSVLSSTYIAGSVSKEH